MIFHKYDPVTFLYLESVEVEGHLEGATSDPLPEQTEYYTLAYLDNQWVSVLRPEYQIVDNKIVLIEIEPATEPEPLGV